MAIATLMSILLLDNSESKSQDMYQFKEFPSLPDKEGMAGMFAGVSNGRLFCMGGANFPDKKPWDKGKKHWYATIFMYTASDGWKKLKQTLPAPLAYGVSIQYDNEILLIGGNNSTSHVNTVYGLSWIGDSLQIKNYPSLPQSLANTSGGIIGDLVMIAGGTDGFTGTPQAVFYGLDIKHIEKGWFELPVWEGSPRSQSVAGIFSDKFYLFSGEGPSIQKNGKQIRNLLQDAWCFQPRFEHDQWTGNWVQLPALPKSVSASASPVPLLNNKEFVFWGGVDAEIIQHADPATHPGLGSRLITFDPVKQIWSDHGSVQNFKARVTLPAVEWNKSWLFISGEIKPGIRTNSVTLLSK